MNLLDVERDQAIADLRRRTRDFVDRHAIALEDRAQVHNPEAMDAALAVLRPVAQAQRLYLPQLPREHGGLGLTWVQRAVVEALAGELGRRYQAAQDVLRAALRLQGKADQIGLLMPSVWDILQPNKRGAAQDGDDEPAIGFDKPDLG